MLIAIEHRTRYRYEGSASRSIQSLRLTPSGFDGQTVHSWSVTSRPEAPLTAFQDGFGNPMHLLAVNEPHEEVDVLARGLVEVEDHHGVVRGLAETVPLRIFLRVTPLTHADGGIAELAAALPDGSALERLHTLMNAIRDRVDYETGATRAETPAAEAMRHGKGVCQDHAHIFIVAARTLGIPARYVTGYMLTDGGESVAHHAWAEALAPDLGWIGFDPANGQCPTDRYIRLAIGLDAIEAAPVRGMRLGGASEQMEVVVSVAQQGQSQSQSQKQQ